MNDTKGRQEFLAAIEEQKKIMIRDTPEDMASNHAFYVLAFLDQLCTADQVFSLVELAKRVRNCRHNVVEFYATFNDEERGILADISLDKGVERG